MAKKNDNYDWLDKYSTDPRDLPFLDVTQRHQDRQERNTNRDAHDRENDGLNMAGAGTSTTGLYDDLVFDGSRGSDSSTPQQGSFGHRTAAPLPPEPVAPGQPPPPAPRRSRRRVQVPVSAPETSLLQRLREIPLGVFVPLLFGAIFVISSLSDGSDTSPTITTPAPAASGTGTPILTLGPGDCFLAPPELGSSRVEVRSCTQPHGGEVIAFVEGDLGEALQECLLIERGLDRAAVDRLPEDAIFTLLLQPPDTRCVVISRSTSLIGSVVVPG
jgi:hypothetical protein